MAGAALLSGASAAQAATSWHVDPTGDVWDQPACHDGYETYAVRDLHATDIEGFGVRYDARDLRMTTRIREYRSLDGFWVATIRSSRGTAYRVRVEFSPVGQTEYTDDAHVDGAPRRAGEPTPGPWLVQG